MKIEVTVKPGSKQCAVRVLGANRYQVAVRARAIEGQANEAVQITLAEHFDVPKSYVVLLKGIRSRHKIFDIIGVKDGL